MNTTTLIVELVIIGLQAMIWLAIIVVLVSGSQWVSLDEIAKLSTLLSVIMIVVAYTLGIVFDAFTAWVEDTLFPSNESGDIKRNRKILRQRLRLKNRELSKDLDNEQYLLRLLRSTTFNLLLISIFGSVYVFKVISLNIITRYTYFSILIGIATMSIYSWWRRRKCFEENREVFYKELEQEGNS